MSCRAPEVVRAPGHSPERAQPGLTPALARAAAHAHVGHMAVPAINSAGSEG